jgi:hypothetical protein
MEEGVLHIELENTLVTRANDVEDNVDCLRFDNQVENLVIVNASLLGGASDDLASLVPG